MAQIKEMPTHIREYYKAMKTAYIQRKEDALKEKEELFNDINVLHKDILNNHEEYLKYGINLSEFPEFINNEYEDGKFLKTAKGAYLNRKNDYELVADLFHLLNLAEKQLKIKELNKNIYFYDSILAIKVNDYIKYIREFFVEVHKKMILEGYGYSFGKGLGTVIINRVKLDSKHKTLDYKATKEKKKEILAKGGRIYNKEEAKFCEDNGIEYKFEDHRVYLNDEYFYEIFMTNQTYTDAHSFEFTSQDYRSVDVRGKSNQQLMKQCDYDLNKICELPVDMRTKLLMCCNIDKTLYTNFIRNENQTSYKYV